MLRCGGRAVGCLLAPCTDAQHREPDKRERKQAPPKNGTDGHEVVAQGNADAFEQWLLKKSFGSVVFLDKNEVLAHRPPCVVGVNPETRSSHNGTGQESESTETCTARKTSCQFSDVRAGADNDRDEDQGNQCPLKFAGETESAEECGNGQKVGARVVAIKAKHGQCSHGKQVNANVTCHGMCANAG